LLDLLDLREVKAQPGIQDQPDQRERTVRSQDLQVQLALRVQQETPVQQGQQVQPEVRAILDPPDRPERQVRSPDPREQRDRPAQPEPQE